MCGAQAGVLAHQNRYIDSVEKELVISANGDVITIALLEDKNLVEIHKDTLKPSFAVGNIYLGRVKRVMQGLNAAFVDIGSPKEAFVHYHDLGDQFPTMNAYVKQVLSNRKHLPDKIEKLPELDREGNIKDVLAAGDYILVQIVKEPISTKGPRLTAEISFASRNMVFLPFGDKISVSQKIKSHAERMRLRQLMQSIKPANCGLIMRTVAEDKRVAELDAELSAITKRWATAIDNLRKSNGVTLLSEELSRAAAIVRDLFDDDFEHIYVDNKAVCRELADYIKTIAPDKSDIVKLHRDALPIFESFGIARQVKSLFGRTVSVKRGAYLIFDQTEAMHVIDVNSGTRTRAAQSQEENALEVNMASATEIARQLRLRDMGGIIVIDFIDLTENENRQKLYEHMTKLMANDRARHNILPLSKFCLMQITRQRVRPATYIRTDEVCPTCGGTGKVRPAILLLDEIEDQLASIVNDFHFKKITLCVHPYIGAYLKKGLWSMACRWRWKYHCRLKVVSLFELGLLEFKFIDEQNNEIDLETLSEMNKKFESTKA